MANERKPKRSREERESEYLAAVEQVFSYPLMPWQKEALLEIRKATIEGRVINANHYAMWREGM
jgi:hypothetical protein